MVIEQVQQSSHYGAMTHSCWLSNSCVPDGVIAVQQVKCEVSQDYEDIHGSLTLMLDFTGHCGNLQLSLNTTQTASH